MLPRILRLLFAPLSRSGLSNYLLSRKLIYHCSERKHRVRRRSSQNLNIEWSYLRNPSRIASRMRHTSIHRGTIPSNPRQSSRNRHNWQRLRLRLNRQSPHHREALARHGPCPRRRHERPQPTGDLQLLSKATEHLIRQHPSSQPKKSKKRKRNRSLIYPLHDARIHGV